jgi:hypothetical protein
VVDLRRSSHRQACGCHARCLGDYQRSDDGGRVWACGRARPRDEASYRRRFEHGRRVERTAEPTGLVGCAAQSKHAQLGSNTWTIASARVQALV